MRIKKDIIKTIFISGIFFSSISALALESDGPTFSGNFVIRQELRQVGTVGVYGPVWVDIKILDIIRYNNIRSLKDYEKWLQSNIKYQGDKAGDAWAYPEETLSRKYGDCEDFAFFTATFLGVLGYQPKVVATGGGKQDHAICIFEDNGSFYWFDNGELKETPAKSVMEFGKYICDNSDNTYLAELNLNQKSWNVLYRENMKQIVLTNVASE